MRLSRTWGHLPGSENLEQLPFQGGQEGENENGPPGCEELPPDRCAEERRTAIDRGSSDPNFLGRAPERRLYRREVGLL